MAFFLLSVVSVRAEINIDVSSSRLESQDASTMRIRDVVVPGFPGKYWIDFRWNPETLVFSPTNAGPEAMTGKSWTIVLPTNNAGLRGVLHMTLTSHPENRTIDVRLTAIAGQPTFSIANVAIVQSGHDFTFGGQGSSPTFTVHDGWNPYALSMLPGVTKTGTISSLPTWFDLSTTFTLYYFAESYLME